MTVCVHFFSFLFVIIFLYLSPSAILFNTFFEYYLCIFLCFCCHRRHSINTKTTLEKKFHQQLQNFIHIHFIFLSPLFSNCTNNLRFIISFVIIELKQKKTHALSFFPEFSILLSKKKQQQIFIIFGKWKTAKIRENLLLALFCSLHISFRQSDQAFLLNSRKGLADACTFALVFLFMIAVSTIRDRDSVNQFVLLIRSLLYQYMFVT